MSTRPLLSCRRSSAFVAAAVFFVSIAALAASAPKLLNSEHTPARLNLERFETLRTADSGSWLGKARHSELATARKILRKGELYSVTFNEHVPISGDKRDYFSMGPYWWPDPQKADGLPYINRDGEVNPERDLYSDYLPIRALGSDLRQMNLAYGLTGEERYAAHAVALIRSWFLDPETGKNPNMLYAQAIPGAADGRGIGIIDAMPYALVVDTLPLLRGSAAFTPELEAQLQGWFARYLDWLLTHPQGVKESNAPNNHATTFDIQALSIGMYIGRRDWVAHWLETRTLPRIDSHIEADGSQPHELKRTKSWNYTVANLTHFLDLAVIGGRVGVDLFHAPRRDDPRIRKALDFVLPYIENFASWPYKQIKEFEADRVQRALLIGAQVYQNQEYAEMIDRLGWDTPKTENYLLAPIQQ